MHRSARQLSPNDDEKTIQAWIEGCLKDRDDQAIIQALCGMRNVPSERMMNMVNSQFSDFVDEVKGNRIRVRLFSVPVAVTSSVPFEQEHFKISDVTPYLRSFYQHGLIDRKNGGIVMLNQLVDHSAIENAALSELYSLSRAIFSSAKGEMLSQSSIKGTVKSFADKPEWLLIPEGYFTMRHLVGVIFWNENRNEPPMVRQGDNTEGWQRAMVNALSLNAFINQDDLEVTVLPPDTMFNSVLNATLLMVRKVVNALAAEARDTVEKPAARLTIGCELDAPGRSQVRLLFIDENMVSHVVASAAIRLSIMESMEISRIIQDIQDAIAAHGINVGQINYLTGPITEEEVPATIQ